MVVAGAGGVLLAGSGSLLWLAERNVIAIPDARFLQPLDWLDWAVANLGPDVPWHFSAYRPTPQWKEASQQLKTGEFSCPEEQAAPSSPSSSS